MLELQVATHVQRSRQPTTKDNQEKIFVNLGIILRVKFKAGRTMTDQITRHPGDILVVNRDRSVLSVAVVKRAISDVMTLARSKLQPSRNDLQELGEGDGASLNGEGPADPLTSFRHDTN